MANVNSTSRAKVIASTIPAIYNVAMPLADTEYSQALNNATKKIQIRMRVKARARFAFVSGDTILKWVTIEPGAVYFDENLDLDGVTIYVQSNIVGQTAEILEWT